MSTRDAPTALPDPPEAGVELLRINHVIAVTKASRSTVMRWLRRGDLPCTRVYGITLIRRSDLTEFLLRQVRP